MIVNFRGAGDDCGDRPGPRPAGGSRHPGFAPYRLLRDELLDLSPGEWIDCCNRLAASRGLRSAAGAPLRFVAGFEPQGALGYEASIFHEGRIACRSAGRGAMHDLHNALVWLVFPAVKATLNRIHVASAQVADRRRGRERDIATLLDESGLLWLSGDAGLDARLAAKDWRGLLVDHRECLAGRVQPIVIGHGLLEKLAAPYKAMTAHCLPCRYEVAAEVAGEVAGTVGGTVAGTVAGTVGAGRGGTADESVDRDAAACIAAAFAGGSVPKLAPLPILGLPGWDPANVDPSYYDDAHVFRA